MTHIRAVIFDMGGTLEDVRYDDALRLQAARALKGLLAQRGIDPGLDPPDLCAVVLSGMQRYGKYREETETELPPERVWPEFVFPNHNMNEERLAAVGEELAFFYDQHFYRRALRPDAKELLDVLRERGFKLGVISNIYSRGAVPMNLEAYGLTQYFQVVLASSVVGVRKPNVKIFLDASRLLGVPPPACAYVGDTVSRDVVGAHRAGYGLAIQIKSFLTDKSDKETDIEPPDAVIHDLMEVVSLVTN